MPCHPQDGLNMSRDRVPPRRRRGLAAGACLALAALLTGCAGGGLSAAAGNAPVISYEQQMAPYAPSFVQTAARSGEVYVQIFGQPFAERMEDQAIAQRIRMPQWISPPPRRPSLARK